MLSNPIITWSHQSPFMFPNFSTSNSFLVETRLLEMRHKFAFRAITFLTIEFIYKINLFIIINFSKLAIKIAMTEDLFLKK